MLCEVMGTKKNYKLSFISFTKSTTNYKITCSSFPKPHFLSISLSTQKISKKLNSVIFIGSCVKQQHTK